MKRGVCGQRLGAGACCTESGGAAVAVSVSPKELNRILHSKTGHNTIFNLAVKGGETTPVMIVDWQRDPIKENLLHIDLKRIDLTKRLARENSGPRDR